MYACTKIANMVVLNSRIDVKKAIEFYLPQNTPLKRYT